MTRPRQTSAPVRQRRDHRASDQAAGLEEAFRDFLDRFLVDIHAGVELAHVFVVELRGERVQRVGNLGILVQDFLAHHRCQVVRRGIILVVLQNHEIESRYTTVGCKHNGSVDLPVLQSGVGQARVHTFDVVTIDDRDNVKRMDTGLTYSALKDRQVDTAVVFATDGRIPAFNFVVLKDDKNYAAPYNLTPVVRKEILDKNPKIADALNALAAKLNDENMSKLNASVDVDKKTVEEVAEGFLKAVGMI